MAASEKQVKEDGVSWNAALYIWGSEIWRVALAYAVIYLAIRGFAWYTPVFYNKIVFWMEYYQGATLLFFIFLHARLTYWAVRESVVDHYSHFSLTAVNKETGRTIFGAEKQLNWHFALPIWWAQTWRMLLIPGAIIAGSLVSNMTRHPTEANYTHLLDANLTKLNIYAAFVISFWATKQSLGDIYRTFRFSSAGKTFYKDGSNI